MRGMVFSGAMAIGLAVGGFCLRPQPAMADSGQLTLTIKDHRFDPATLQIPAGQKIRIVVHNSDPSVEEFDSDDLRREKVIPGGAEAVVFVGPLDPGVYHFIGEYNSATAQGQVVVK